ncbi:hypothetical protein [Stenotrophomonas maltophilia]
MVSAVEGLGGVFFFVFFLVFCFFFFILFQIFYKSKNWVFFI